MSLCLCFPEQRAWVRGWTHFSLTFLPGTFQFDIFTGHISVWPFYWAHFKFDLFTGHISVWPFYRAHFSLTFLPDTFQFNLFTGHISVWPNFYRTHFSLTCLPDTFQFDLFTSRAVFQRFAWDASTSLPIFDPRRSLKKVGRPRKVGPKIDRL